MSPVSPSRKMHLAALPVRGTATWATSSSSRSSRLAEHLGVGEQAGRLLRRGHEAHNPTWSGSRTWRSRSTHARRRGRRARLIAGRVRETPAAARGRAVAAAWARGSLLKAENLQLTGLVQGARRHERDPAAARERRWPPGWWRRARATTRRRWPSRPATAGARARARDAGAARRSRRWRRCASTAARCASWTAATTRRRPRPPRLAETRGTRAVHAFDAAGGGGRARAPSASRSRGRRRTRAWSWCRSAAAAWRAASALAARAALPERARGGRAGGGVRALHRLAGGAPARSARARPTRSATASPSSGRATSRCRSWSATWTRS